MLDLIWLPWACRGKVSRERRAPALPQGQGQGNMPRASLFHVITPRQENKSNPHFLPNLPATSPALHLRKQGLCHWATWQAVPQQTSAVTGRVQGEGKPPGPSRSNQESSNVPTKGPPGKHKGASGGDEGPEDGSPGSACGSMSVFTWRIHGQFLHTDLTSLEKQWQDESKNRHVYEICFSVSDLPCCMVEANTIL